MIACARMYAVSPAVADAWRRLFAWVAERARVSLAVVDHPAPAPLGDLWARPDMACVFMCGLPLARRSPAPHPVAAPVASPPRYGGRAAYFTDFVVRADAAWTRLEDTFGTRFAFTTEDSHSGYNAARFHLLAHRRPARPALYRRVLGPYVTPRRVLDAVLSGEADVAPIDSYVLDLLRRHEPKLVSGVRVVDSTDSAPIPPLVAAAGIDDTARERLTRAFLKTDRAPELRPLLDALVISRFAAVQVADYAVLLERATAAEAAGYARIA
jgi:ABC-type phosphate/phosphonate transport system substrate-binding protein